MPHAFISYVRDDSDLVDYIARVLEANGVAYWRDKNDIKPGVRWRDAIRTAISEGRFFVAVFSKAWEGRDRAYANEELVLAIEELRIRPTDRAWFIPVKVDACAIPDRPIGGGERLSDINYIDLPALGWKEGLKRLLAALGVENPLVELGDPLGSGMPPSVRAKGGRIVLESFTPDTPAFAQIKGTVFTVTEGWVTRDQSGDIIAYLKTQAPFTKMQQFNEMLGLDSFHIFCREPTIEPDRPSAFEFSVEHSIPAGTPMWDVTTGETVNLPYQVDVQNTYIAQGVLAGTTFSGTFVSNSVFAVGTIKIPVRLGGSFDINLEW